MSGPRRSKPAAASFNALPLLGSAPFLLVNGDVWTDIDFGALRRAPPAGSLAHLVLVPNPPQHARGDFVLEQGMVSEGEGARHTYSGIGIYSPGIVRGLRARKISAAAAAAPGDRRAAPDRRAARGPLV